MTTHSFAYKQLAIAWTFRQSHVVKPPTEHVAFEITAAASGPGCVRTVEERLTVHVHQEFLAGDRDDLQLVRYFGGLVQQWARRTWAFTGRWLEGSDGNGAGRDASGAEASSDSGDGEG